MPSPKKLNKKELWKKRLSLAWKRNPNKEAINRKRSETMKGRKFTPEHIWKMTLARRKRKIPPHTEEHKKKIGQGVKETFKRKGGHPFFKNKETKHYKDWLKYQHNKIYTAETRELQGKIRREYYKTHEHYMTGKHLSTKQIKRLIECNTGKRDSPETLKKKSIARLKYLKENKDYWETKVRPKWNSVHYISFAEVNMQSAFRRIGIPFRTEPAILGKPDLFIKPNFCIFCDGEYYHDPKKRGKHDRYVTRKLRGQGYRVIRFWNRRIKRNLTGCVEKIILEIEN